MNEDPDSLLFMAFSDWRVQSIDDVITFLQTLERLPDLILYGGDDIGRFWDGETNYFSEIAEYSKSKQVLAVIGNDDTIEIKQILQSENVHDLHDNPFNYKSYSFIGLEGATSKPGIVVYTEKEVKTHLKDQIKKITGNTKILVSHAPPYGILDKGIRFAENDKGYHNIGSKSLLSLINSDEIKLVICGHCHSHGGISKQHKKTLVINVASHDNSGAEGKFALIEITSEGIIDLQWHSTINLIPKDSLLNLTGIGHSRNKKFQNAGIINIKDLLKYNDIRELSVKSGVSEHFLYKTQLKAKAYTENTIYQVGSYIIPENKIYFDIETDIACERVWLIGLLVNDTYVSLYADDWNEEKDILYQFLQILRDNPNSNLMSYSGTNFDKNVIYNALKRHGLDSEYFMLYSHYDLCQMIRRSFIFPYQNFKLKDLGASLGYNFKHQDMNGLMVALAYHSHVDEKKPLDKKYIEYNEDDVNSTKYIANLMQSDKINIIKDMYFEDYVADSDISGFTKNELLDIIRDEFADHGKLYIRMDKRYGGYQADFRFSAKDLKTLDLLRCAMLELGFSEGSLIRYKNSRRGYVPYYGKGQTIRFIQLVNPNITSETKEKLNWIL